MHIKQTLPDIKARIQSSLQKYKAELDSLGDSMLGNSGNIVLNIITEFCNEYRTVLEGSNQELSSLELSGGARISFVFHELYSNGVKAVDPFDQIKDIDIRTILYNSSGSSPALFVGTMAFEVIVKQQIKRLEEPSLKCVSLVYDELVRILAQLLTKQMFRRYPSLKEKFHAVAVAFFRRAMEPTNKLVRDLVTMEACYINTGHPDFLNGHRVGSDISLSFDTFPLSCAGLVFSAPCLSTSTPQHFSDLILYLRRQWPSLMTDTTPTSQCKSIPKRARRFRLRPCHRVR